MTQAIGPSTEAGSVTSGAATASLEAQLLRYQKQLSECVNCASSKTAEGKAEIQEISGRIGEIRERIDRVTGVKASGETAQLATSTAAEKSTDGNAAAVTAKEEASAGPAAATGSVYATVGSVVDVRA